MDRCDDFMIYTVIADDPGIVWYDSGYLVNNNSAQKSWRYAHYKHMVKYLHAFAELQCVRSRPDVRQADIYPYYHTSVQHSRAKVVHPPCTI